MKKPWIMTQEWHHVLFLHWAIEPHLVEAHIPPELDLDVYGRHAWVSVVLFKAKKTRPRFMPPVPVAGTYLELNVRTYVKYKGKSGVFFFSLDADSPLAVKTAATGNFLPYRRAEMAFKKHGETWKFKSRRIHENSPPEALDLSYRKISSPLAKGPLENWLTERYCLWTKPNDQLFRVDIQHSPWQLSYVKGSVYHNTMAGFLPVALQQEQAITHYSGRKKVRFYPPVLEVH